MHMISSKVLPIIAVSSTKFKLEKLPVHGWQQYLFLLRKVEDIGEYGLSSEVFLIKIYHKVPTFMAMFKMNGMPLPSLFLFQSMSITLKGFNFHYISFEKLSERNNFSFRAWERLHGHRVWLGLQGHPRKNEGGSSMHPMGSCTGGRLFNKIQLC